MHLNLVYRAYRAPYDWVPQLETANEKAIARLDVTQFRVPGAAPIGRQRVVQISGTEAGVNGALCVPADESPPRLSAGG